MSNPNKLKFPILKNVEYLDVTNNKTVIKTFNGRELEGLTWRELQSKIGAITGGGAVYYSLKFVNDNTIHKGKIRSVAVQTNEKPIEKNNTMINELESIKKQINSIGNSQGVSVDLLLSISKQSYETQIGFLNNELVRKENLINKLETQIDNLNDELEKSDELIDDLKSKTGIGQYLEIAQTFLKAKTGGLEKVTTLKDSNPSDVPPRIIELLGAVDWTRVDQHIINEIINYMEMFLNKLPLKG